MLSKRIQLPSPVHKSQKRLLSAEDISCKRPVHLHNEHTIPLTKTTEGMGKMRRRRKVNKLSEGAKRALTIQSSPLRQEILIGSKKSVTATATQQQEKLHPQPASLITQDAPVVLAGKQSIPATVLSHQGETHKQPASFADSDCKYSG